jgi:hypothetical protein
VDGYANIWEELLKKALDGTATQLAGLPFHAMKRLGGQPDRDHGALRQLQFAVGVARAGSHPHGRVMEKLNFHSTGELMRFAVRNGLID